MRSFITLVFNAICVLFLVQCGRHQPGDPPRGEKLPQFFGVFLWDGQLDPLQAGNTLWRGDLKPPLDGIVLYDSVLTSGNARPEEFVKLSAASPVRKEIEYIFTPDGEQLARVEVRDVSGFLDKGDRLALKIMPLEKPGAVMVVPVAPLGPGLYVLDFMGKKHRFAIGMGSKEESLRLATKARDRVLKTKATSSTLFGNSRALNVEETLRDPEETDKEAQITLQAALENWERKNYADAIIAAVISVAYHPNDQRLIEIVTHGRLAAAKEALAMKNYADAERWAEQAALHDATQNVDVRSIIHEVKLLPHLHAATIEIEKKNFRAAQLALEEVAFELRKDLRFSDVERTLKRKQTEELIQKTIDARQWDEALVHVNVALGSGTFDIGHAKVWISRIRQGAAADRRYFGALHQPVWEVKLGEGEMRMHDIRKVPGADLVVVCLSRGQINDQASFAALKASTGEVEWIVPMPEGGLTSWSEDGRYAVMSDSNNGFQSPEHCYVVDLKERKRLPGTERPWPARHSAPVAIHGGKGLFAIAIRSRELAVDIIDLDTGEVRLRIAPTGIRGDSASDYNQDMSFVRTMCFSRDGQKLLTFSEDETLRLFDVATGKQIGNGVEHRTDINEFRNGFFDLCNDGRRVLFQISGLFNQSIFRTMDAVSRNENLSSVLAMHPDFSLFIGSEGMLATKRSEVFSLSPEGTQQRIGELKASFGIQCASFDEKDSVIYIAGGGGYVARLAVAAPNAGDDAFSLKITQAPRQIDPALAERLVSFVSKHHVRTDQSDVDELITDYAARVDYYNYGIIQPARLRELLKEMVNKASKRTTTIKHQPEPHLKQDGYILLEYPVLIQEEGKQDRELTMSLEVRLEGTKDEIKIVRKKSIAVSH